MNKNLYSPLIFEHTHKGRKGYALPDYGKGEICLPPVLLRSNAPELPEVDEPTVVRHYTNSSNNNFGVDTGFYPLGSCTMKYNPKVNEAMVSRSGVANLHPAQPANVAVAYAAFYVSVRYRLVQSTVLRGARRQRSGRLLPDG